MGSRGRASTATCAGTGRRERLGSSRARAVRAPRRRRSTRRWRRGSSSFAGGTRAGVRAGSTPSSGRRGSSRRRWRRSTARFAAITWSRRSLRGGRRRRSASSGRWRTTSGRSTARRSGSPPGMRPGSSTAWTTTPGSSWPRSPALLRAGRRPGPASSPRARPMGFRASCSPTTTRASPAACSGSPSSSSASWPRQGSS
jgi:hypothetical protein